MAPNKFKPHVYILPEDDANRQLAVGFELNSLVRSRSLQVLPTAGGWIKALAKLNDNYFSILQSNAHTHIVVLIDCDGEPERIKTALDNVPTELRDRVFILGARSEPEKIKADLRKSLETLGQELADECAGVEGELWQHNEMKHNHHELARAKEKLGSFLFEND